MKTALELNELILGITEKIRGKHPELLNYLNEMPVTIPNEKDPHITVKNLASYYDSLVSLLDGYEANHPENVLPEKIENSPITKIKTMETVKAYPSLWTVVNNISISYNDIGEGSIPVIFLHGYPFDKSMWKLQLESLKSTNRVIAIDIRGFGKSTDEETNLSIDLFAEDLVLFMDNLNIDKAVVCGLSMGGFISLNAIKRFPERFEALILCDTQCIADTPEIREKRYATIEEINHDGVDVFNEKFVKSVFHPDSLRNKGALVENLSRIVFSNSKGIITGGLTALAERSETCSTLDAIRIPTLIICGREDEVTPLVQSEYMHKHIEGSILKVIDEAGHVSNLEHPDEFNIYLQDFLNSLNAAKYVEPNSEPLTPKIDAD